MMSWDQNCLKIFIFLYFQITNELQRVKDDMSETGQNITDGSKKN